MIQSFTCPDKQDLFAGKTVPRFVNIQSVGERKLQMIHRASRLDDSGVPPDNRLEASKGDRKGQYRTRINDQWRICLTFDNGHAFNVSIVDYH